ncbi:MAG: hypothetical protein PHS32_17070 [Rhodoferax sp.]|uniref:hypothetical protein n=1 Tax=Rhodoferax sp. TaxID=50421 RepID=UPI00262F3303|nr:hypothetical protein [Rhodoferax sp.]MDD5335447.1 hypothetical protein [Rhodoferax sp.]
MPSHALNAIFLLAVILFSTGAKAQNTYRCGNSYSQTPCPGGVIVDAADARTESQKAQTDKASKRDAQIADAMEKARLQQEAKDLAANTPAMKLAPPASASKARKKRPPRVLFVKAPVEKKKKKTPPQIAEEKNANKP